ncbi:TatD DNase family protein [Desulfoprunum benzoelyticum]|uniref:TatD DNase family protein n=2 Tax=Desulfoprunum benzoelyticum TaxID=1506996 RepID=A0A840UZJ8_9BACT|nr:TatD DNase family protein [Desulfoprunum benzoelyticum]
MNDYVGDLDAVIERARQKKVEQIITIGIDLESSKKAVSLAGKYPGVRASVGIHPHDLPSSAESTYAAIVRLVEENREHIAGYGEIGLDYAKMYCPMELQQHHFRIQLELAKTLNLPVIIHDRDAHEDVLRILEQCGPFPAGGVMHCFSGDYTMACRTIDLGFFLSVPGIVTFKNANNLREVARKVPLTSLLLETDGPFLAPQPWRGKRNEPAYILATAACIADLRNISLEHLARTTTANATALFQPGLH